MLTEDIKESIKKHAIEELPMESCGLIIERNKNLFTQRCKNIAENPTKSFSLDPRDYVYCTELGKIVGCYHSHPTAKAEFTEFDKQNSSNHKIPYVVYSVTEDKFNTAFSNSYYQKYTGKSFQIGEQDCFTLIQQVYSEELKIKINNYKRAEGWSDIRPDLFDTNYANEGFIKVWNKGQDWQDYLKIHHQHDVAMVSFLASDFPTHAAIILDEGKTILHQPRNKKSVIEKLSQSYINRIAYVLRHESI